MSPSTDDDVTCAHCGLPVPAPLVEADGARSFCCGGCRAVYKVLNHEGLADFYRLAANDPAARQPARTTARSYAELDDPVFTERHCERLSGGLHRTELYLEGVHCTACVWLVERLPRLLEGVVETRLDLGQGKATVTWSTEDVTLSTVAQQLDRYGYPSHPFRGSDRRALARAEDRRLLIRIAVAGAAAGNVMLIAFALYAGMFSGIAGGYEQLFRWASLAITTPAVLYSGRLFFRGAIGGLRAGALHMDLPISLGILAGFAWGTVNTIRGGGEIYFDSVTTLIFLLLIGRWLQRRQQRRAADATELLFTITPPVARVIARSKDGAEELREVPVEALTQGARIEVRAGESIPVDGLVIEGHSAVDASLLSGESRPVTVAAGDTVRAGTTNVSARLRVEATAVGELTRLGQLMQRIEEHARRRAPIVLLAERIAGRFVAATLTLAVVTAGIWLWRGPAAAAIDHAIALLIVTCPCALGLATPLAVSIAIGRAARRRILIQGGDALERLARPGRMILDKTGTLTEGKLTLVDWQGEKTLQPLVAALEAQSSHPVARAAVATLGGERDESRVEDVRETPGGGIAGVVDGAQLMVGSPAWIAGQGFELPGWVAGQLEAWTARMLTPVLVVRDGDVAAAIAFGDKLRDDAAATLARLSATGWRIEILSGDHPAVVAAVGHQLGVDASRLRGGASPEDKLHQVERAVAAGEPVVMVGDGVNDAAALAAATAGVAVHGGAEASLAVADVAIGRPGLAPLDELVAGARATLATIKRNFLFSLGYNLIGASLAMAGLINPLVAAVLMPLSSLTVLASSLRSRAFRPL